MAYSKRAYIIFVPGIYIPNRVFINIFKPPFPDSDTENRELNSAMPSFIKILEEALGEEIKFKICDLPDGLTVEDTVDGVHPRLYVHDRLGKQLAEFVKANYFGLQS